VADRSCILHPSRTMDSTIFGEPVAEIPSAILLSGLLQFFLTGIVGMQTITYWSDYKDDSRRKRVFVAAVILFCLCVTLLNLSVFYLNLVSRLQTILEGYKTWRTTIFQKRWVRSWPMPSSG
jgi:hypothetical protein